MSGKWHIYVHLEIIYWNANELIIKGQASSNIEGKQPPFIMNFFLWISAYLKECSKVHISLTCKKTDEIGLCISWPLKGDGLKVTGLGNKQGRYSYHKGFFFFFFFRVIILFPVIHEFYEGTFITLNQLLFGNDLISIAIYLRLTGSWQLIWELKH